jgi:short-chain Z-isoprenyl diphosphate synthase
MRQSIHQDPRPKENVENDSDSDANNVSGQSSLPHLPVAHSSLRAYFLRLFGYLLRPIYWYYERRLDTQVRAGQPPCHIGLILDGNRRFARNFGIRAIRGHEYGIKKLREFLQWCLDFRISHVTLYVFSTENFTRSSEEVQTLLDLFVKESAEMLKNPRLSSEEVRVRIIGQRHRLPQHVIEASEEIEISTANRKGMLVTVALAYGGREEITDACKALLRDAQAKQLTLEELAKNLTPEDLERYLYTAGTPDPDFIIRTSGEQRLSGFLLWQSAYSEFYFCDALWPDFRRIDFLRALRSYQQRERRFGR